MFTVYCSGGRGTDDFNFHVILILMFSDSFGFSDEFVDGGYCFLGEFGEGYCKSWVEVFLIWIWLLLA